MGPGEMPMQYSKNLLGHWAGGHADEIGGSTPLNIDLEGEGG